MWNQNISTQRNTSYYSYAAKKKQEIAHLAKYKIFILLISRSTYKVMKQSLEHMQKVTSHQELLLSKLWNHMNRASFNSNKTALQKLKQNVVASRARENMIKNFTTLLERMTKYKLKKSFASIGLFAQRKNQAMVSNIDHMRKIVFCRKVQKVFASKKKQHLLKMIQYSNFVEKVYKKVKTVGIISRNYVKNAKVYGFNRLVKNLFSLKAQVSVKQPNDTQSLQKKLKQLQTELQKRNVTISKLEQQVNQLRIEQTSNNYNSFSQYSSSAYINTNPGRGRNKSMNRSRKGINQSIDSGLDFSIGSILGNSFSLSKSRSKDLKHRDSVISAECNCGYKEKYVKMKNTNQSLKNQLQIVKEQLDVAKDLNDHFTNEIKQYFGGQKDSIELDRLKKQVKDLQRQRQQLRMKVIKYQHHINTLKSQFKTKIQQLYRKVKKQR